jgi:hypothetical protein
VEGSILRRRKEKGFIRNNPLHTLKNVVGSIF